MNPIFLKAYAPNIFVSQLGNYYIASMSYAVCTICSSLLNQKFIWQQLMKYVFSSK